MSPVRDPQNPQAAQMADESMLRTLAAQCVAVWPQEEPLLARYALPADARVLDVACGTGELARRLAGRFPGWRLTGVDVIPAHLEHARAACAAFADRVDFELGDAFHLAAPDGAFDLTLCRHLVQAVPRAPDVVRELVRVTRPGGVVHVVAEDYGMMHFHPTRVDTDRFWREGPVTFARRTGTDLLVGRKAYSYLLAAGLEEVRVDYVVVDTVRVPREVFADVWRAWRDGYAHAIAEESELELEEIQAAFATMIDAILDPGGYAVWQLPVVSGRVPAPSPGTPEP